MSKRTSPVTVLLRRLPNMGICATDMGLSSGFLIDDSATCQVFIGETVKFAVVIQNCSSTTIQIQAIETIISTERNKESLDPVNPEENGKSVMGIRRVSFELKPMTTRSLRYSKLVREIGNHNVRVSVVYNNSLMEFVASANLSFESIKPFDLAFSRFQLNSDSYMINTTLTNRLSTPMMIHSLFLMESAKEKMDTVFNSCTSSIHLQPGSKLSHILIVKGRIIEGDSIGSLGIHFTAPGHQEIGLNSTPIVVTDTMKSAICGYYEVSGPIHKMEMTTIQVVVTNQSDKIQMVSLDWSSMKGNVLVVGECLFNKLIQPNKTIYIPLQVLAVASGSQQLDPPILNRKEISFSPVSLFVI
ncbi:hypothetical protein WA171_007092 [Blastocystis sp. BT1]